MVRKIKDRVRSRFHISLSEVGGQETWQRAVLGFAMAGGDRDHAEATVEKVVRMIEGMGLARIANVERETLVYGEEPFGESGLPADGDDWVPEEWQVEDGGK